MILVAVALASALPFAPPDARPLRIVEDQVRTAGRQTWTFSVERRVTFRRVAQGWDAALVTIRVDAQPRDAVAERFLRGTGALVGETLRFHLDAAGRALSLDDQPSLWKRTAASIDGLAHRPDLPPGAVPRLADLPAADQFRLLAGPLTAIIRSEDAAAPPGREPATLRANPISGKAAELVGTRTVVGTANTVTLRTIASGVAGGTRQAVDRTVIVDRITGLLREQRERQDVLADGAAQSRSGTISVTPVS